MTYYVYGHGGVVGGEGGGGVVVRMGVTSDENRSLIQIYKLRHL